MCYKCLRYVVVPAFFQQVVTNGRIYICSNDIDCCPLRYLHLPAESPPFFAPYWTGNDPSIRGNVSYEVHTEGSPLLQNVSIYISIKQNVEFNGTWMMVAYWHEIQESFQDSTVSEITFVAHVVLYIVKCVL